MLSLFQNITDHSTKRLPGANPEILCVFLFHKKIVNL